MTKTKRIAVIGLGPAGQVIALHLQHAGFHMALFGQEENQKKEILENGIKLIGSIEKEAKFTEVYTDISKIKSFDADVIIAAIKSHQVPYLLETMAPYISGRELLICAQNGIDTEFEYNSLFSSEKLLRMVLNYAGRLSAPNTVMVTFFNPPNYLSSLHENNFEISKEISVGLSSVGLTTGFCKYDEMRKNIWEKTILNSSLSALCALSKLSMKEVMSDSDLVNVVRQTIEEAIEVAKREKISIESGFLNHCMDYLTKAGDHFPSLALDFISNNATEIDLFNGKIVDYGKKHNFGTPINSAFTYMMRAMTLKAFQEKETTDGE